MQVVADIASGAFDPADSREKLEAAVDGDPKKYDDPAPLVHSDASVNIALRCLTSPQFV